MSEMEKNWVSSVNKRLDKLEKKVADFELILHTSKRTKASVPTNSKGPSNAISKLIQGGFLDTPKAVKEIKEELAREGYYYSIQNIDSALRRMNLSKILSRIGKRGQWRYVIRK
jgi:hypothetical protein